MCFGLSFGLFVGAAGVSDPCTGPVSSRIRWTHAGGRTQIQQPHQTFCWWHVKKILFQSSLEGAFAIGSRKLFRNSQLILIGCPEKTTSRAQFVASMSCRWKKSTEMFSLCMELEIPATGFERSLSGRRQHHFSLCESRDVVSNRHCLLRV